MKIKTDDKSEIEIITTDSYTGEGLNYVSISIYNSLCRDSSYINLSNDEVIKLINELNECLEY